MKLLVAVLVTVCLMGALQAETVTVRYGSASIQVPVPEGFVQVPEPDPDFVRLQRAAGVAGNDLVALFLPPAGPGGARDFTRQFSIQVEKGTPSQQVTLRDFAAAQRSYDAERKKEQDQQPAGIAKTTFEPAHDTAERYISAVVRAPLPEGKFAAAVLTTALVRGRVWFFYAQSNFSATPEDITWAKSAAQKWMASILLASPSDPDTLANERSLPEKSLTVKLVQGAVTLLVLFGIYKFIKRKPPGSL